MSFFLPRDVAKFRISTQNAQTNGLSHNHRYRHKVRSSRVKIKPEVVIHVVVVLSHMPTTATTTVGMVNVVRQNRNKRT